MASLFSALQGEWLTHPAQHKIKGYPIIMQKVMQCTTDMHLSSHFPE